MKRILAFTLALLSFAVISLHAGSDRIIQLNQLPKAAQLFVTKYFAGRTVSLVKEDREFSGTTYDLTFSDGTEIEFDARGGWKEVDGKHTAIPTAFIPAQITKTLQASHAGDAIVQIERKGRGYKVELTSGIDAYFNARLQLVRYDD